MPKGRFNGGIIGPRQTFSTSAARGVINVKEHQSLQGIGTFPRATLARGTYVVSYNFNQNTLGIRFPTTATLALTTVFTVDFWCKVSGTQTLYSTIADSTTNNTGIWIGNSINNGGTAGRMNFRLNGGSTLVGTTAINDNVWRFFRMVRSGSNGYLFVNGTLEASTTSWTAVTAGQSFSDGSLGRSRYGTGSGTDNVFNGSIAEFRFIPGVALTTANFSNPTTKSTATTETVIYTLHDVEIYDGSSGNRTLSPQSNYPGASLTDVPPIT